MEVLFVRINPNNGYPTVDKVGTQATGQPGIGGYNGQYKWDGIVSVGTRLFAAPTSRTTKSMVGLHRT